MTLAPEKITVLHNGINLKRFDGEGNKAALCDDVESPMVWDKFEALSNIDDAIKRRGAFERIKAAFFDRIIPCGCSAPARQG